MQLLEFAKTSSHPSLNFYRGQKVRFLALSLNNTRIWAAVVWKPSKISSPFLNSVCSDDLAVFEHPIKRTKNLSLIVNNSAADWPISLKFGTYIDHMIPDLPRKFKIKGSRSGSRRDVTRAKICQIVKNSAGGCSISIKFTTDYDHVTSDLP